MFITLFEDDSILAIDKPSGLPSNSLKDSELSCESLLKSSRGSETFFLLHRLDTGTSGVLLFAKNEQVYNEMREQFKLKNIKKNYLAWSAFSEAEETKLHSMHFPHFIRTPLAHHPKSKKKMITIPEGVHRHMRGKPIPAHSIIHKIKPEEFLGTRANRFEIEIETGVMHQIRVHLSSLGFPLIGDEIYGHPSEATLKTTKTRLALHAHQIEFSFRNFQYQLESPWPSKTTTWSA